MLLSYDVGRVMYIEKWYPLTLVLFQHLILTHRRIAIMIHPVS